MAITKLNSLAIPDDTIVEADLSYPLTNFSSTGIDDNASSTAVTIDSSQRVGIGTASPDNKFHVVSGSAGEVAQFTGAIEARGLSIRSETNTDASAHVVFNSQSGGSKGMFTFETDGAERMRIDSSGTVRMGVDTGSYGNALVVDQGGNYSGYHDSAAILVRDSTGTAGDGNYHGAISFSKGTGQAAISAVQTGSDSDSVGLSFWTHASGTGSDPAVQRMLIDGSGTTTFIGNAILQAQDPTDNSAGTHTGNNLIFLTPYANNVRTTAMVSAERENATFGSQLTALTFHTRGPTEASSMAERLRIKNDGNIDADGFASFGAGVHSSRIYHGSLSASSSTTLTFDIGTRRGGTYLFSAGGWSNGGANHHGILAYITTMSSPDYIALRATLSQHYFSVTSVGVSGGIQVTLQNTANFGASDVVATLIRLT